MTWIMLVLTIVQAKHPKPPPNTYSKLLGYVFPTLKYHCLYPRALEFCNGYYLHRCEFHFKRYLALHVECLDKCLC